MSVVRLLRRKRALERAARVDRRQVAQPQRLSVDGGTRAAFTECLQVAAPLSRSETGNKFGEAGNTKILVRPTAQRPATISGIGNIGSGDAHGGDSVMQIVEFERRERGPVERRRKNRADDRTHSADPQEGLELWLTGSCDYSCMGQ